MLPSKHKPSLWTDRLVAEMATAPQHLISEQEYLNTTYRPDCDYVDGFILERNVGTPPHARLQTLILAWLVAHELHWRMQVLAECRLKIRDRKYRIPDIMVLPADAPRPELVIEQAPLLCIEVVSPRDRLAHLVERAGDYLDLGVPETWICDPRKKNCWIYSDQGTVESSDAVLRHNQIELPIAELFGQL